MNMLARKTRSQEHLWQCSPKQRALESVLSMIYLQRPLILEKFLAITQAQRRVDGMVTSKEWVEVMALSTRTPVDFPWTALLSHLCPMVRENGDVPYMEWLVQL